MRIILFFLLLTGALQATEMKELLLKKRTAEKWQKICNLVSNAIIKPSADKSVLNAFVRIAQKTPQEICTEENIEYASSLINPEQPLSDTEDNLIQITNSERFCSDLLEYAVRMDSKKVSSEEYEKYFAATFIVYIYEKQKKDDATILGTVERYSEDGCIIS